MGNEHLVVGREQLFRPRERTISLFQLTIRCKCESLFEQLVGRTERDEIGNRHQCERTDTQAIQPPALEALRSETNLSKRGAGTNAFRKSAQGKPQNYADRQDIA